MTNVIQHGNPLLYDKIAQELNEHLALLGWIDDLYPVCFVATYGDETYPEVYINDGAKVSLRVLPDSTKSMSFFVVGGMTELDEWDMEAQMSLCVWVNLQKIDPGKKYDYTTEIIRDCFNVLRNYGCYDMVTDINTPFGEFTQLSLDVLRRPYTGFRINFNKTMNVCNT